MRRLFHALGPIALAVALAVSSSPVLGLHLLSQWGGPCRAVAGDPNLLILGVGHRLITLDLSIPNAPLVLARSDILPGPVQSIVQVDEVAYVADGWPGLYVFRVSPDGYLQQIAALEDGKAAFGVAVAGTTAYLAAGEGGLCIVDVSDPESPGVLGEFDTPDFARRVAVEGSYAYVADGSGGLQIINVSDPAVPSLAGSVSLPGPAMGIAVAGNLAYVAADYFGGLQIIDVTDPAHPVVLGSRLTGANPLNVMLEDNLAWVANGWGGVSIMDVSDPALPEIIWTYDTPGDTVQVARAGQLALVADLQEGFAVLDASDPRAPTFLGGYSEASGEATDIEVLPGVAFLANGAGGMSTIDVSDPTRPHRLGNVPTREFGWGITIAPGRACLADGCAGLGVIDSNDAEYPSYIGQAPTGCASRDVVVQGDYAYVADDHQGLLAIDISEPTTPVLTGTWQDIAEPGYPLGVAVHGDVGYLAGSWAGLDLLDITDPSNISRHARYVTAGAAQDVILSGSSALVAADWAGLEIVDVSDPSGPVRQAQLPLSGNAQSVVVAGQRGYVATGQGIDSLSLGDFYDPILIDHMPTSGATRRLAVDGELIFAADGENGMMAFSAAGPMWSNPDGGDYGEPYNWTPIAPPLGSVLFALPGGYAITMDADYGSELLTVQDGAPTIDLAGRQLSLFGEQSLRIGITGTRTPRLVLQGGTVDLRQATLGEVEGSSGTVDLLGPAMTMVLNESDGFLEAGFQGTGSLNLSSAAVLEGPRVYLGVHPNSLGQATIRDAGSTLRATQRMVIGNSGVGEVTVAAEGLLHTTAITRVAEEAQGQGSVRVMGPGSRWLADTAEIDIGAAGQGELHITAGGEVTAWTTLAAVVVGSSGTISVRGDQSKLTCVNGLLIGREGNGKLTVEAGGTADVDEGSWVTAAEQPGSVGLIEVNDGGTLEARGVTLAYWQNSDGTLRVTGPTAKVTSTRQMQVARMGFGRLAVAEGAELRSYKADSLTNTSGLIGMYADSVGTVEVSQGRWIQDGALSVGWFGSGTLSIGAGGLVENPLGGNIGRLPGSTGHVIVSGAEARWAIGGELVVGGLSAAAGGTGRLEVLDGGAVQVGAAMAIWPGSTVQLAGGGIAVGQAGAVSAGALLVGIGGTLRGGGAIEGRLTNTGGIVMPGSSSGLLAVDGVFEQHSDGILEIEIGGTEVGSGYDRLSATGTATLGGRLRLRRLSGFVPAHEDTFVILAGSQVTGQFGNAPRRAGFADGVFEVLYSPNAVSLSHFAPHPCDFDTDGDVDQTDRGLLEACARGPAKPVEPACLSRDVDHDQDVDQSDFAIWQRCLSGEGQPAEANCAP